MEEIFRIGRKQTNSEITVNEVGESTSQQRTIRQHISPTGRRSDFQITSGAQECSTKSFPDGQHKARPRTYIRVG